MFILNIGNVKDDAKYDSLNEARHAKYDSLNEARHQNTLLLRLRFVDWNEPKPC